MIWLSKTKRGEKLPYLPENQVWQRNSNTLGADHSMHVMTMRKSARDRNRNRVAGQFDTPPPLITVFSHPHD